MGRSASFHAEAELPSVPAGSLPGRRGAPIGCTEQLRPKGTSEGLGRGSVKVRRRLRAAALPGSVSAGLTAAPTILGAVTAPLQPMDARVRDVRRRLLRWARQHGRSFWWREQRDPYVTAVVEVLLRQTRAEPVVEEALRFVARYPAPEKLADADVAQLAEDLRPFGLYRQRAEQLKALGWALVERPGGFPRRRQDIASLPGVGPYATAAIRCFVFGAREPVVDVNLVRIIQRVFGVEVPRGEGRRSKDVSLVAESLLAGGQPRAVNWALLDLGALVCTARQPRCGICPLAGTCQYQQRGFLASRPSSGQVGELCEVE